jgi:hypothetical protein
MDKITISTHLINNEEVKIIQEIQEVFVNEEIDYENNNFGQNRLIDFKVTILYDNKYVDINYWILINKIINEYSAGSEREYLNEKLVLRQKSLLNILDVNENNIIYNIILMIESFYHNPKKIDAFDYENIKVANLLNLNIIDFDIFKYGIFILLDDNYEAYILNHNSKSLLRGKKKVVIMLLPLGHINLYFANIEILKHSSNHMYKYGKFYNKRKTSLYEGSFKECKEIFDNNIYAAPQKTYNF